MKRLTTILGTTLAMWAALATIAAAATLGLTSGSLGAGRAGVTSCGASSLSSTRRVDNSGNVTQVVVSGIPQSCAGKTLSVTLKGQTGASLGTASTTVGTCTGGCTATFTSFGGTVSAPALSGYAYALSG
jgi:hypothetical protein